MSLREEYGKEMKGFTNSCQQSKFVPFEDWLKINLQQERERGNILTDNGIYSILSDGILEVEQPETIKEVDKLQERIERNLDYLLSHYKLKWQDMK